MFKTFRTNRLLATALAVSGVAVGAAAPAQASPTGGTEAFSLSSWQLSTAGVGPVTIGMTGRQALASAGRQVRIIRSGGAARARTGLAEDRLEVRLLRGRVARIAIRKRGVATLSGIRVGDSVADLHRVYRGRMYSRWAPNAGPTYVFRAGAREVAFATSEEGLVTSMTVGPAVTGADEHYGC